MATLSAHGKVVGVLDYVGRRVAVCADGVILENHGEGWKLHAKLKPGYTPEGVFARRAAALEQRQRMYPAYAAYRELLFSITDSLKDRVDLNDAVALLGDDPDALYSSLQDEGRLEVDLDDLVKLCDAYTTWRAAAGADRANRPAEAAEGPAAPTPKISA